MKFIERFRVEFVAFIILLSSYFCSSFHFFPAWKSATNLPRNDLKSSGLQMAAPLVTGVFLRSFDVKKVEEFYGNSGLGLKTLLMEGNILKVELPSKIASIYFKEDKECILNRPQYEWEDDFSEEKFQQLLKDVESGPYAEYITEDDRKSGFQELDYEREYINARAYADGTAYFGVGITLPGTTDTFDKLISKDYQIIRLPGTYMFGASLIPDEDEMIQHPVKYGIAADPDEYIVEVNEEPNPFTPQEKVVLCVLDVEESTDFYTKVLGFDLIRKRYNLNNRPRAASCTVYLGDKESAERPQLELQYRYATEKLEHGVGFEKLTLLVSNLDEIEQRLSEANINFSKNPGNIQFVDLNGYQITLLRDKK